MSSYFFLQANKNPSNDSFLNSLQQYAEIQRKLVYVLNRPLTDQKYNYSYTQSLIILSPGHKIAIIDYGNKPPLFTNYVEDIVEDIGAISDKYEYKAVIGRPRQWKNTLLNYDLVINDIVNISDFFQKLIIIDELNKKKIDLLISLFIGSINDIDKVKDTVPLTPLDKVKQKIQLFDGDQTRFVYQNPENKRITIQGLSGTGKTELLLHKLKDIYVNDYSAKIYFTCHNKVLADSLRKRIPAFFNFMKVEQQIEWEKRLWCTNAWGSRSISNSGAYRYICSFYKIPFFSYSHEISFSKACKMAIDEINSKYSKESFEYSFSYMFIDESQDFDEHFFALCEMVTEKNIYVAGDIFQSIFDDQVSNSITPDFLLGKCYRTDPKTLMFAHALGMGLFEQTKLRWLEEKEWRDCGYNVVIENKTLHLSREPIRRFEDLDDDFESIKIVEISYNYTDKIIALLKEIIEENQTVTPDDIGIIFLDLDNDIYKTADLLEIKIQTSLSWNVNKAYETKEKRPDTILISNRNNVKGLEFPFVICITKSIKSNSNYRNSLYTMLTRSFIRSYLLIPNDKKSGLTPTMNKGLRQIISENKMVITEPSEVEKKKINTSFKNRLRNMSYYDLMMSIFKKLKIEKNHFDKLFTAAQQFDMLDSDEATLTEFLKDNYKYIKEK